MEFRPGCISFASKSKAARFLLRNRAVLIVPFFVDNVWPDTVNILLHQARIFYHSGNFLDVTLSGVI